MATAAKTEYVTLGGLLMGSKGISTVDLEDLKSTAPKRGEDLVIPGQPGVTVRSRVTDALRAAIVVMLNGRWTQDNVRVARASWVDTYHAHLDAVRAVCDVHTEQAITLHGYGGVDYTATAVVVSNVIVARQAPAVGRLGLDLLLPDGPLVT